MKRSILLGLLGLLLAACPSDSTPALPVDAGEDGSLPPVTDGAIDARDDAGTSMPWLTVPAHFPPMPVPADNPLTDTKVALGKKLFFDPRLSRTGDISCSSCHRQEHAFADPERVSRGVEDRLGTRNAPALVNLAWVESFFWDGRAPTLEDQVLKPIEDELEMDLPLVEAIARLLADPEYDRDFREAYGEGPSERTLAYALASYLRTLLSGDSPWDRYEQGDEQALTARERRGRDLFFGEPANCFHCHLGFNLTNERFAHNGTFTEGSEDEGRKGVTGRAADLGRFRVVTLRNVAVTAPYMHDGSIATLSEVVEHYARGGRGHPRTDPNVSEGFELDAEAKQDLVAFLEALTDDGFLADPRFSE